MQALAFVVIAAIVLFVVYAALALKIVKQHEQGLVERFGKYKASRDPGLQFIVPFIDRMRRVDMREIVVDVPPQEVITKDNVVVTVDAVVYYQATDPVKLVYNVQNFVLAATKLAQTNLRNVVGDLDLDDALTSREVINAPAARHSRRGDRRLGHQGGPRRDPAHRPAGRRHRRHAPPDEGGA